MIHHGQRLTLGLKPRHHFPRVHAQFDDLQRHSPPHRFLLLGHPDDAEATLTDLLQQLVAANPGAGYFGYGKKRTARSQRRFILGCVGLEELPGLFVCPEQRLDFGSEPASPAQMRST